MILFSEKDIRKIEVKWQKRWREAGIFEAEPKKGKKYFVTFPYPYINAAPHVGHAYSATRADMMARFMRLLGYNVLFPFGLHATGEPIMGAAKRIAMGDQKQIEAFVMSGIPREKVKEFDDPVKIVKFFAKTWVRDFQNYGLSVDWRRTFYTTKLNPEYNKFVTWQYKKLKKMGLVVKGKHPVIWCPSCESPTGSHDRKEGENATVVEYILLKFKFGDAFLPAATLRPETIFGVTNMWLNPEGDYVRAKVDDEVWIVSKESVKKLRDQEHEVEVLEEFKGKEIIGKSCVEPLSGREIPILPASFVDVRNATGVVMSVPAHAPYDYMALKDLGKLNELKPITIIKSEIGENPAEKICEQMGITSQEDEKLEQATKIIYRREFHKGILNEKCGEYSGKRVRDIKQKLVEDFSKKGMASIMYEASEPVICRCLTRCHVKIIKDQWFLKYSDEEWKKRALECLKKMKVYPDEARNWLENAIINMKDKACARKSGLGTPLPWDPEWIIEPLSDSTIYMSYYIIAKYVREGEVKAKNMKDEFFDYVLLGEGNPEEVGKKCGLDPKLLREIREEFEYFYPVDLRNSGKDLLPHHLPFFIFHHVVFFPEKYWPRAIGANGWVTVDGEKMSKSKGNFITLRQAVEEYGADASRLAFLDSNEGLADADFRRSAARNFKELLLKILMTLERFKDEKGGEDFMDDWLRSRIQFRIMKTREHLEKMENRSALLHSFHGLWQDITKYIQRKGKVNGKTIRYAFDVFARINVPFAPHTCEEIWERLGKKGFVHQAKWPEVRKEWMNEKLEYGQEIVDKLVSDVNEILNILKKKPSKITFFVASTWKREVLKEPKKLKEAIKEHGNVAIKLANILKDPSKRPKFILDESEEFELLESMKDYFKKVFNCEIEIKRENESEEEKAKQALPGKPAILVN